MKMPKLQPESGAPQRSAGTCTGHFGSASQSPGRPEPSMEIVPADTLFSSSGCSSRASFRAIDRVFVITLMCSRDILRSSFEFLGVGSQPTTRPRGSPLFAADLAVDASRIGGVRRLTPSALTSAPGRSHHNGHRSRKLFPLRLRLVPPGAVRAPVGGRSSGSPSSWCSRVDTLLSLLSALDLTKTANEPMVHGRSWWIALHCYSKY